MTERLRGFVFLVDLASRLLEHMLAMIAKVFGGPGHQPVRLDEGDRGSQVMKVVPCVRAFGMVLRAQTWR